MSKDPPLNSPSEQAFFVAAADLAIPGSAVGAETDILLPGLQFWASSSSSSSSSSTTTTSLSILQSLVTSGLVAIARVNTHLVPIWAFCGGQWIIKTTDATARDNLNALFAHTDPAVGLLVQPAPSAATVSDNTTCTYTLILVKIPNANNTNWDLSAVLVKADAQILALVHMAGQSNKPQNTQPYILDSETGLAREPSRFLGTTRQPVQESKGLDLLHQHSVGRRHSSRVPFGAPIVEDPTPDPFTRANREAARPRPSSVPPAERPTENQSLVVEGTLEDRERQALQHLILASLRLRGVARDAEFKEVYGHTIRAAQFAVAQKRRRNRKNSSGKPVGIMEMQDIVDKLLNVFLPE
ncbi:uncharacterized protein SAPINGB_P006267 [Magnusiomyces paraingens]|uniref:Sld7 C-terminal domain-containing protein n=1 Tax=Magnusiomyces paraingens TaxID=2606893 RepID=A0A5E8C431_9ASCO|nr:uncharacterized protein SAPINGB_P006267 [Saprochaete ingens]VVT58554.1 unnamed protein product [Saprochaete ingens]